MFTYEPAEQIANLKDTKAECGERLKQIEQDLSAFFRRINEAHDISNSPRLVEINDAKCESTETHAP
jgi:hypothetical protein